MTFPPGPDPQLEMLEPHLRRLRRDPIEFFRRMAAAHPGISYVRVAWQDVYLVHDPAHMKGTLGCPALRKGYGVGQGERDASEAPQHQRWLALFAARHLRRAHLVAHAPMIVDRAVRHQSEWRDGQILDPFAAMRALSLEIIGTVIFGDAFPALRDLIDAYATRFLAGAGPPLAGLEPPVPAADDFTEVEKRLDDALRTVAPGGLFEALRGLSDGEEKIPHVQVREIAVLLLLAGHETVATVLGWCWFLLGRHPDVQSSLQAEVDAVLRRRRPTADDRLPQVAALLSEVLRLYPPGWILGRHAAEDCELQGWPIGRGALVVASPFLMQRDERHYDDPAAFDPSRWLRNRPSPGTYLPFGLGPRRCAGESLAWLETTLIVATLVSRWGFEAVEEGMPVLAPMLSLRPRDVVHVRLSRR